MCGQYSVQVDKEYFLLSFVNSNLNSRDSGNGRLPQRTPPPKRLAGKTNEKTLPQPGLISEPAL
jgi:hypothetical protein